MKYLLKIDNFEIELLEKEEKYLEIINLFIDEMKYNYELIKEKTNDITELVELYNSVAYLGKNNSLMPKTEKRILNLVKGSREKFINIFEMY